MFTGLVETIGQVRSASATAAGRRIEVDLGVCAEGVRLGDSIAIDGCCQTVAAMSGTVAAFDAVPETLRRTTLGDLSGGDRVNLERSLAVGARLGGHFVQGHIDGTARLSERRETGGEHLWVFEAADELLGQMVAKGSIAISGVSLTLVEVAAGRLSVALIPTTLRETTLGGLAVGGRVNIETDILGKYVLKFLGGQGGPGGLGGLGGATARGEGLTMDALRQAGFLE